MTPVEITRGCGPVVVGLPHGGTWLPPGIHARLTTNGRRLTDTDWHIHDLYDGLLPGVTCVRATFHRYVIDANRPPDDTSLYPGQNTTALVPMTDFDGQPIWTDPPSTAEIATRRASFHAPYHAALEAELARVREAHGTAILYDAHSIRGRIPFLFDATLPDLNIGTASGTSCDPRLEAAVRALCDSAEGYTTVSNGRFKGGWTTRHYGRPADGVHAIQMELAQSTYLQTESPPFAFCPAKAARLRPLLARILQALADLAPQIRGARR